MYRYKVMKKFYWLLLICMVFSAKVQANPGPDPRLNIYEFYFEPSGDWVLRISFDYCHINWFDSILVQSSTGIQKVISWTGYFDVKTIKQSDLSGPLSFDPAGDVVAVIGFGWYPVISSGLRYGNVISPDVYAPLTGQSVSQQARYFYGHQNMDDLVFSLDNTPNSNQYYDPTGTCGTLYGKVFEPDMTPAANKYFWLDWGFWTDDNGNFSTQVFSRIISVNTIYSDLWPHYTHIAPLQYGLHPDSIVHKDIYLLDTVYLTVQPPHEAKIPLKIFPNPVKQSLTVSWSADMSQPSGVMELEILDISGRTVYAQKLSSNLGTAVLHPGLADGYYVALLKTGKKVTGTSRFLVSGNR